MPNLPPSENTIAASLSASTAEAGERPNPTNVGGQAVLEGVMMRAPGALSVVCRRRDGTLVLRERTVTPPTSGLFKAPLIRGIYTLVSSIRIGHQALRFSAEVLEAGLLEEEERAEAEKTANKRTAKAPPGTAMLGVLALTQFLLSAPDGTETSSEGTTGTKKVAPRASAKAAPVEEEVKGSALSGLMMAVPILLAVGLFIALPQIVAEGVNSLFNLGLPVTSPGFQAITGAAKLTIIVSYMSAIRLIPDVRRMFQYHGAEHKSISTYEARQDLLVENARKTSALHARCGTTFIIMVAFVSVVLFSAVGAFLPPIPGPRWLQSVLFFFLKLPLLPVVAGITFEIQRVFARYCTTGPLQVLLWPGFVVQKITTAPPDDDQLEVALASLRSALANAPVKLPDGYADRNFPSYSKLVSDPSYQLG